MGVSVDFLIAGGFYTFALAAIAGAVGLIVARNVFHSALFLVVTLASVACIFVILGADFLAAVQILVYIGAVMILVLFAVMLTPQSSGLPTLTSPGQALSGIAVAALVFFVTAATLLTAEWPHARAQGVDSSTTDVIGTNLFTTFALPFEIASVLLLVAMIGAIVIARED
jgi:NADH:ubiquinone oxidoreductase subunit 6 (subunit J)